MPTTYAVASAKGGVGKTTTAANLAATLAAAGFETVAVDGDVGTANLAPALGVEVPEDGETLHDVLAGEADPVDATYRGPHGLAVIPGDQSLSAFRTADPSRIREVLASITGADYVIVDTGAGLTHESALPLSLADGVLLVSTPTRDALVDTGKTLELTEKLGGDVAGLALNRVESDDDLETALAAAGLDPDEFDAPLLGRIPEDATVAKAHAAGEPLSEYAPGGDAAAGYRSLASSLTGEPIRPPLSYEVEAGEQEPAMPDGEVVADDRADTDDAEAELTGEDAPTADEATVEEDVSAEEDVPAEEDASVEDDATEGTAVEAAESDDEAAGDSAEEPAAERDTEVSDSAIADAVADVDVDESADATEPATAEFDDDTPDDADDAADANVEDGADDPHDGVDPDDVVDVDDGADADDAADADDPDDAVIIEGESAGEEDEAATAARSTVLDEEEYAAFAEDGPVTVEDAESGEAVEVDREDESDGEDGSEEDVDIGDDVIPFAEQGRERSERAKADTSDEPAEDDETKEGGFLSRLFR